MTAPTPDDELDRALAELRSATPPPAAYAALRRARSGAPGERPVRRRRIPAGRMLALALTGLAVAGTATAAVTASGPFDGLRDSATADAPAARNLGELLSSRSALPGRLADLKGAAASGARPIPGAASAGEIRGTTVSRDGISVDVAFDDRSLCLASPGGRDLRDTERTLPALPATLRSLRGRDARRPGATRLRPLGDVLRALPTADDRRARVAPLTRLQALRAPKGSGRRLDRPAPAAIACFPATAAIDTLPSVTGRDGRRLWLAAVVPDDVSDVRVTDDRGRTLTPEPDRNVVIAVFPDGDHVAALSWTAPDGRHVDQDLGDRLQGLRPVLRRPALP